MRKNKKKPLKSPSSLPTPPTQLSSANCCEGQYLNVLLQKLSSAIKLAKQSSGVLPDKIWLKQQFSIGANDVTRVLERMPRGKAENSVDRPSDICSGRQAYTVELQAVLLAADCAPRLLTKHIPSLASSRKVPIIFIKDNKRGSFRLGELVNVKTAMAVGVKAKGSRINETMSDVLQGDRIQVSRILTD